MDTLSIRVLLVDDSPLALKVMERILSNEVGIEVVGKALDGFEALDLIAQVKPTLICTDYFMPKMNGLELVKQVMGKNPLPILVVSSLLNVKSSVEIFPLLEAGALDCIQKPIALDEGNAINKAFVEKIRILSKVFVIKHTQKSSIQTQKSPTYTQKSPPQTFSQDINQLNTTVSNTYKIIAIGSSTGGPSTLLTIFKELPADFSIPIICVQHISKGFLAGFVDWLKSQCRLNVKIMEDKEPLKPFNIYLPQEGTHLMIEKDQKLIMNNDPPIGGHRPSIDAALGSVAKCFGKETIGILLTGMGEDGAKGMEEIHQSGGLTIAQNEESCAVFGMPKVAIERGAVDLIMTPQEIASFLTKTFKS